jgi:sulfur carrier protein
MEAISMELTVSGEKRTYPDGLTVAELIAAEKVATPEYVTVSVNEQFVDPADLPSRRLDEGDRVEFLYFMGGGAPPGEAR